MSIRASLDLTCYESLKDFGENPNSNQPAVSDDLNALVEAIEHFEPAIALPMQAAPISPEKASLRLAILQLQRRPLSDLVRLRSFASRAQEVYSELNQRDLMLMGRSNEEGSLEKADSYHKRSKHYLECEQSAKRIQRDTTGLLEKELAFTGKSNETNFN